MYAWLVPKLVKSFITVDFKYHRLDKCPFIIIRIAKEVSFHANFNYSQIKKSFALLLLLDRLIKLISYKNDLKSPNVTQIFYDSSPYYGACLHEIWGRIMQILCDNSRRCVIRIKNEL